MITFQQALSASVFHEPRPGKPCARWRRNGRTKTWKTRPGDFWVPVKFGLYDYGHLTPFNTRDVHVEEECPFK